MSSVHRKVLRTDVTAINNTLSRMGLTAHVPARNMAQAIKNSVIALSSQCIYTLSKDAAEDVSKVEKAMENVLIEINAARIRQSLRASSYINLLRVPILAIVVDSPVLRPLEFPESVPIEPFNGLWGESYGLGGREYQKVDLNRDYQTLVAALSGHGKTNLMQNAVHTMAQATPKDQLDLYIIDLKGQDFKQLEGLEQVRRLTSRHDEAIDIVSYLDIVKSRRRDFGMDGERTSLLVIDEMAELYDGISEDKPESVRYKLASVMNLGRTLGLHTLIGTQYPNAKTIGNRVNRAFTTRIVGRVDSAASAANVAGIAGTDAEKLSRKGSFVVVRDGDYHLAQSYIFSGTVGTGIGGLTREQFEKLKKSEKYDLVFGPGNWSYGKQAANGLREAIRAAYGD